MRTITKRGLTAESSRYPSPHFSNPPGRKFSTTTSHFAASSETTSCPSGLRRSTQMSALLRKMLAAYSEVPCSRLPMVRTGSPSAGSTLMTSAPKSASNLPQNGPATVEPISSTRYPASGPEDDGGKAIVRARTSENCASRPWHCACSRAAAIRRLQRHRAAWLRAPHCARAILAGRARAG